MPHPRCLLHASEYRRIVFGDVFGDGIGRFVRAGKGVAATRGIMFITPRLVGIRNLFLYRP